MLCWVLGNGNAFLFGIGVYGALSQTNLVMIMMGVELILAGALVNLVAFWRFLHPESYSGQMFVLVVMTVMAVEMAVGFGGFEFHGLTLA